MTLKTFIKTKLGILAIAVAAAAFFGVAFAKLNGAKTYNLIEVKKGDISQEVIVTGKTTPLRDIELSFERAGKVTRVRAEVGNAVGAGQILAELASNELRAQLDEAEANEKIQQAKLDELTRGTRPEDIQIAETEFEKAAQNLAHEYDNTLPVLNDAYSKADDAVRNQVNILFSNPDSSNPQLAFAASDSQAQIDAQSGRAVAGSELVAWRNELKTIESSAEDDALEAAIRNGGQHLRTILSFLNRTMDAVISSPSSAATTYKTNVTTARSAINAAITNVSEQGQAITSAKIGAEEAYNKLVLERAGSTEETIRAQEAAVAQAKASAAVIMAQIEQTIVRSPIRGTVTKQDAKVGEVVAAHTQIAKVISDDAFEIDVNIPEVDIGKISVKNPVSISFDAFSGETFRGSVIKIDPAETIIDGVVNFKTVVGLAAPDKRLKSGLTANLAIETLKKTGVLILPQAALIEKKEESFVKKFEAGSFTEYPVETGIRDAEGNVEIISGAREGERVLNIGLK